MSALAQIVFEFGRGVGFFVAVFYDDRAVDRQAVLFAEFVRDGTRALDDDGSGGLGWFIYENKNQLEIPAVFAGLFTVILIGLFVENVVFRTVELRTVRRWGMQT